jgi:hypothetical protein
MTKLVVAFHSFAKAPKKQQQCTVTGVHGDCDAVTTEGGKRLNVTAERPAVALTSYLMTGQRINPSPTRLTQRS